MEMWSRCAAEAAALFAIKVDARATCTASETGTRKAMIMDIFYALRAQVICRDREKVP